MLLDGAPIYSLLCASDIQNKLQLSLKTLFSFGEQWWLSLIYVFEPFKIIMQVDICYIYNDSCFLPSSLGSTVHTIFQIHQTIVWPYITAFCCTYLKCSTPCLFISDSTFDMGWQCTIIGIPQFLFSLKEKTQNV